MLSQTDNRAPTLPSSKCRLHFIVLREARPANTHNPRAIAGRTNAEQARHREGRAFASTPNEVSHRPNRRAIAESRGDEGRDTIRIVRLHQVICDN